MVSVTQPGDFASRVAAILFEDDPLEISVGINADEYEPEAGTIVPRLREATGPEDVQDIVYQEFCSWFGEEDVGRRERYRVVAARIWNEWRTRVPERRRTPWLLFGARRGAADKRRAAL